MEIRQWLTELPQLHPDVKLAYSAMALELCLLWSQTSFMLSCIYKLQM